MQKRNREFIYSRQLTHTFSYEWVKFLNIWIISYCCHFYSLPLYISDTARNHTALEGLLIRAALSCTFSNSLLSKGVHLVWGGKHLKGVFSSVTVIFGNRTDIKRSTDVYLLQCKSLFGRRDPWHRYSEGVRREQKKRTLQPMLTSDL